MFMCKKYLTVLWCVMMESCGVFQAALCRSSQPLSGFSARCEEDEQLLDCILRSNPNTSHMIVVDTRPKVCGSTGPPSHHHSAEAVLWWWWWWWQ